MSIVVSQYAVKHVLLSEGGVYNSDSPWALDSYYAPLSDYSIPLRQPTSLGKNRIPRSIATYSRKVISIPTLARRVITGARGFSESQ